MADKLEDDLDRLVANPREDALISMPFARSSKARRSQEHLPDGYIRYHYGGFSVNVSPWGLIMVRQADWLSKFALAIHGDINVANRFARIVGDENQPIEDPDHIERDEILLHLPTYNARVVERDGFLIVSGDKSARTGPAKEGTTVEGFLRRAELARLSEEGHIDDVSVGALTAESVAKGIVFSVIHSFLDDWLRWDPDLGNLSEEEKQTYFIHDAKKTTKILLFEFFSGTGPEERAFDETHAITHAIIDSPIGYQIRSEIAERFANAPSKAYQRPLEKFHDNFAFSPDQTAHEAVEAGRELRAGLQESASLHAMALMRFMEDQPAYFFIGGCEYDVDATDFRAGPRGLEIAVTVTDEKTLKSLFAHSPSVENLPRQSEIERMLAEELTARPYSTTKQRYKFYLPRPVP